MRYAWLAVGLFVWLWGAPVRAVCVGDCNADAAVTIDELVRVVAIALEGNPAACPAGDFDGDGEIRIDELITAVNNALLGCPIEPTTGCNGSDLLCERRFDEVSFPTTHNAFNSQEDGFSGPNQTYGITRQLRDGIRAMMLDTYSFATCRGGARDGQSCPPRGCGDASECVSDVYVCHGTCLLGKKLLVDVLVELREFLDQHPREILSIIFESYITPEQTAAAIEAADLLPSLHAQALDVPWPTLAEMIDAGHRLVVFTEDSDTGGFDWHHYIWDYAFDTPFSFATPADLSCAENRGQSTNGLFLVNHFLTQVVGSPELAEMINHDPLFIDRVEMCMTEWNRLPNFVAVDFYEIGDLFSVVDRLNDIR